LVTRDIDFVHVNIFNLLTKACLSLILIKYLINEFRVKIKFLGLKLFCRENHKIVIIIELLLHQNFVPKSSWSMLY